MNTIEVNEAMLKAVLELLYKTNDCLAIKIAMGEFPPCDRVECDEAFCPYCSIKNLTKYLTGKWEYGEYDD